MTEPEAGPDAQPEGARKAPTRATAVRHLVLGFALLVTILFTAALCSLPR
ncbi:MAG: hypothetical protein HYT85_17520 [candidate division NC10 bacterium]|nr:hypothetical protein [candidate division NC10 bacterium]MBI2163029.1 hypothetical protein [candidate division NC10 bacterium]MBI2456200.1 hypothetical protein [candidate division NC10 bacterium]MBI2563640.1 hypothetical protein [candidate division NC10 bacterium]MBI3086948.1 hypothetical protein [candidate division NC10 bacterium]